MMKKMKWFGVVMMLGFFMTLSTVASAQYPVLTKAPTAQEQMAITKFKTVHGTTMNLNQYEQSLEPTQTNYDNWRAVLSTFSRNDIKSDLQNSRAVISSKGVNTNSDFSFIADIVKNIQRRL